MSVVPGLLLYAWTDLLKKNQCRQFFSVVSSRASGEVRFFSLLPD
jgi:hypothetical protein